MAYVEDRLDDLESDAKEVRNVTQNHEDEISGLQSQIDDLEYKIDFLMSEVVKK